MAHGIMIGGRVHKIEPLTLKRWGQAGRDISYLAIKGWPRDPEAVFKVMVRVLKTACPTLRRREIKRAAADELVRSFHQVMDEWKIGRKAEG